MSRTQHHGDLNQRVLNLAQMRDTIHLQNFNLPKIPLNFDMITEEAARKECHKNMPPPQSRAPSRATSRAPSRAPSRATSRAPRPAVALLPSHSAFATSSQNFMATAPDHSMVPTTSAPTHIYPAPTPLSGWPAVYHDMGSNAARMENYSLDRPSVYGRPNEATHSNLFPSYQQDGSDAYERYYGAYGYQR